MADRRFRPKKGKNPESIPLNVEFIKNLLKEPERHAQALKSIKERCSKSVREVLREEGITL
tara:strand:- start:391 stop:573 length:183 start_codon:yes stop_codon:yes gene_type:complete